LSTKIHTLVDALGNPLAFFLTPTKAHDLEGADALLPQMEAHTLLADKAYDADERVIDPLRAAGKTAAIHPGAIAKNSVPMTKRLSRRVISSRTSSATLRQNRQKLPRRNPVGSGRHLAQLRTGPGQLFTDLPGQAKSAKREPINQ
jgi:IS5 family transposase